MLKSECIMTTTKEVIIQVTQVFYMYIAVSFASMYSTQSIIQGKHVLHYTAQSSCTFGSIVLMRMTHLCRISSLILALFEVD